MFGDATIGLKPLAFHGSLAELTYGSACVVDPDAVLEASCGDVAGGVMNHGLNAALDEMFSIADSVAASIEAELAVTGTNDTSLAFQVAINADPRWQDLQLLSHELIDEALEHAVHLYRTGGVEEANQFVFQHRIVFVALCCFLVLLYALLYSPLLDKLRGDIQGTRALVLLIPADVILTVQSVREFIKESFATV
jgi:hypothetical protein